MKIKNMTKVKIINFGEEILPFFKKNIPVIGNVEFTDKDISADYAIIFAPKMYKKEFRLNHDPSRIWVIVSEPDAGVFAPLHDKWQNAGRVYGYSDKKYHEKYIATPHIGSRWFVGKSYDEIMKYNGENKLSGIGWVTSNKGFLSVHKKRMEFLKNIKLILGDDLHLSGSGFKYLETKWDGLAPYKYNLAIDNWVSKNSIDEKPMDCWAGLSLPLYYGSPDIHKYFPEKSFVRIDIEERFVGERIKEIINSDLYEERLPYILEARDIVLNKHNVFHRLANDIIKHNNETPKQPPEEIVLEHCPIKYPLMERIKTKFNNIIKK